MLEGLFEPRAAIYWPDLLVSAAVAWGSIVFATASDQWSAPFWTSIVVGVFSMYRAVLFIHELTHLKAGVLRGFDLVWNILVGMPMLMPSFSYVGVHNDHHRRRTYGTPGDPEYLPLACGARWRIVLFLVETMLLPLLFVTRFVIVGPISFCVPPLRRFVERHGSSLVINASYLRREGDSVERRRMFLLEAGSMAIWGSAISLAARGTIPWHLFVVWYLVSFGAAFVNQVRTLAAHRYRNPGPPMDVVGQIEDSVSIPGGLWTELWAPVGLRYHALHHYLSDLPYHALGTAHRKLMAELPADAPYRRSVANGLARVLGDLWLEAGASAPEAATAARRS